MKRPFKQHRPFFSSPANLSKRRANWLILPALWTGLKRLCMGLGFIVLINMVIGVFILSAIQSGESAQSLPSEMVLFLEFEGGLDEVPQQPSFSDPFVGKTLTVQQMVDSINHAADDPRVQGILARMRSGSFSMAHVGELRAALKHFRDAGKFAYIYSSSYGDGGGGLGRYYLASAFDEIWMQPLGVVSITGVHAEMPFLRGVLDKVGVEPEFIKREDYKTAYENLTNRHISPENKEMMERLVDDVRAQILDTIPSERGISKESFEALVDKGLFTAKDALDAKLITHADYGDVLMENIAEKVTGARDIDQLNMVKIKNYAKQALPEEGGILGFGKSRVALVYAVGAIMPSAEGGAPMGGGNQVAAADEIAPAILDAAKDDEIKAIILRVDSPGGSPTASESILRAVEKAKEAGKPVIVSMGPTAASGGYWISAYGDKIFAQPATITGSIGVIGGKFSFAEVLQKLDVSFEGVSWGKNSGMWAIDRPFSESEAARINLMLDDVYDSFLARVAKGRKMDVAAVDKIAGGRVWSGLRAKEIGLVDELGGLSDALDFTAVSLGKQGRDDLEVVIIPAPKTALEAFAELIEGEVSFKNQLRDILAPISQMMHVRENPRDFMTYEELRIQ